MAITASQLRQDVYRLLDEVLDSGVPLEIKRRGRTLRIVPAESGSKIGRLKAAPNFILGEPEDLIQIDWSGYWEPDV